MIGGNKGYRSSDKVFQVDECMNNLLFHSKMNTGRVGHSAVLVRNKDIYVVGGYNSDKNEWLSSVESCADAFEGDEHTKKHWVEMAPLNEARYYFGCCTWGSDFIFVFGGMNDRFMSADLPENQSKCLNSIERYNVDCNRWDSIDLKTYQKFAFCSYLVAIHLPWDKDRILIVGG